MMRPFRTDVPFEIEALQNEHRQPALHLVIAMEC
jgi:hypothetical protein